VAAGLIMTTALATQAALLKLTLPLGRQAYQTNERIDLALTRSASNEAMPAATLDLTVSGDNGSRMAFAFPLAASAPDAKGLARATEHLHLDARLLRPGVYTLSATAYGVTATNQVEVYSHIRKSSFRLISWGGRGKGADQVLCGEDAAGLNLMYACYAGHDQDANIRGGMDYMRNDTMGGAHQMDGRLECDWSDPLVLAGGMARVARQALHDRRSGNVIGVHFYDEPGLTWQKHPKTGVFTLHNIPSQDWAWKAAMGSDAMQYTEVDPKDPASVARWEQWLRWKQCFMEASWRLGKFSVDFVQPGWLSAVQTMYAWHAFGDGYYFNIARALPVMSGHGGYDDLAGGYLCPGYFFEFGRMRDYDKPVWYLPQWWENVPSDLFRLEQYLTFMMGAQGMATPPGTKCEAPDKDRQGDGMLESNRQMLRLGTIFTTMPVTRGDVAVLYSMSQNVKAMLDSKDLTSGQDFPGQVERLQLLWTASKLAHIPLFPVVEEDVLDGTVAATYKAIVLTGLEVLDPRVVEALKGYIAAGGTVIMGDECKVQIPGAVKLGAEIHKRIYIEAEKEFYSGDEKTRRNRGCSARSALVYYREGAPIAKALTARCKEIGISPIVDCDEPEVFASRHADGDVEYLFLVNAASDPKEVKKLIWNGIRPAKAVVAVPDDGRPLYDAMTGGEAREFKKAGGKLSADLRFGAGQMRAFARTARPIGAIEIEAPALNKGAYAFGRPTQLGLYATVVDAAGRMLSGAIPLSIRVTDPLGANRYDLLRATERGVLKLSLPLGANEPAGEWKVTVRELLSDKESSAAFKLTAPGQCGALVGTTPRAVMFPADYENIFRFFRLHRNIALVIGTNAYNQVQAERLEGNLSRWGITCQIVKAGDIKAKVRSADVKKTWAGAIGNPDLDMPADAAILMGSFEDNAVLRTIAPTPPWAGSATSVLPYPPVPDVFPGRGRGMIAWQTDCLAFYNYETVSLIAHDADGLAEAVGMVFEIASGYRPATDLVLPAVAGVTPATVAPGLLPEAKVAWQAFLPDRAVTFTVADGQIEALSLDGTLTKIAADGTVKSRKAGYEEKADVTFQSYTTNRPAVAVDKALLDPTKVPKFAAKSADATAIAYWGGSLQVFDAAGKGLTRQMLPQDFAGLAWSDGKLIAALVDGRVLALTVK
jgi:hypothetical protein